MNLRVNLKQNFNLSLNHELNLKWGSAQYSTSEKFVIIK